MSGGLHVVLRLSCIRVLSESAFHMKLNYSVKYDLFQFKFKYLYLVNEKCVQLKSTIYVNVKHYSVRLLK